MPRTRSPCAPWCRSMNSSASSNSRSPAASSITRTSLPPSPPTQRLLDAKLAAELDERCNAVAQELGNGEAGVEPELVHDRVVVGADVARIAAHSRARARDTDLQEWLAEIVPAPDVGDQPVRGAVPGMHMGV